MGGTATELLEAVALETAHTEQGRHTQHKAPSQGLLAFPQPPPGTPLCQPGVLPIGTSVQAGLVASAGGVMRGAKMPHTVLAGDRGATAGASPLDLAQLKVHLLVSKTRTHFVLYSKILENVLKYF